MEALVRALGMLEGSAVQAPLERLLRLAAERTWHTRGRGLGCGDTIPGLR